MKYEECDKLLDYYNFNLSKNYSENFTFNIIPTTFSYGFLLIPSAAYTVKKKDDTAIKNAKNSLWNYIRNWNCSPDRNTYACSKKVDKEIDLIFLEKDVPKSFRSPENEEKLKELETLSGDVYFNYNGYGNKKIEGGVTHVSVLDYRSVKVAHQISQSKIESSDEIRKDDWINGKGESLVYEAKRPKDGKDFRIYLNDVVLELLEKEFAVTLFADRMNGSISENESIEVTMVYYVEKEKPRLDLTINKVNKYDGKVVVEGGEIDAKVCKLIEDKFRNAHIIAPNNEKLHDGDVYWKKPFDWYEVPKKKSIDEYDEEKIVKLKNQEEFKEKSAVYMWVGHKKGDQNKKYLYIGIVGTRGNKGNSVGKRILDQERITGVAAKNNVIIDKIRFSAIERIGNNVSIDEVLQTVEMQCINNVSSLFAYSSNKNNKEQIITNLFDGVCFDGKTASFELLNDKNRYHN